MQTLGSGAASGLLTATATVAAVFVDLLIILVLTLYLLSGFPKIKAAAYRLVPASRRMRVTDLGDRVLKQMGGYLSGATIIAIQAGLVAGVFAAIVGLPYPWAIGLAAAVLDFIPVVGPITVGVGMTLIGFTQGLAIGIIAGVFYLAQHMFEAYWLYPQGDAPDRRHLHRCRGGGHPDRCCAARGHRRDPGGAGRGGDHAHRPRSDHAHAGAIVNAWRSLGVADQFGRRVVVTGANTGLGYQTSLALASAGAEVVMAVRDLDRGQAAAQAIRDQIEDAKLRVIHLDLADLASVRDFAESEAATGPLDLLVNNAGLMLVPRRELTRDGFEMQMGVNHLGHFALTAGLLPALLQAPAGRVVSVTSIAARRSRSLDHGMGLVGNYTPMRRLQPVQTGGRVVRRGTRPPIAGHRVHRSPRCWRIPDGRRPRWSAPMTIPASRSGSAAGRQRSSAPRRGPAPGPRCTRPPRRTCRAAS